LKERGFSDKFRSVFTAKEDEALESAVRTFGPNDWDTFATQLPGRSTRQCRERWCTYLAPDVNRTPWTADEDRLLFDVQRMHGPKWGILVRFFCNRTQNNIKNRWYTIWRKAESLGLDPRNRQCFIETGQKIASRSTQMSFERPKEIATPDPQQTYSLANFLNSDVRLGGRSRQCR
jgi:hypothetical protein